MRLDNNYLIELELASLFELRAHKSPLQAALSPPLPTPPPLTAPINTRTATKNKEADTAKGVLTAHVPSTSAQSVSADARAARIATLSWDELAADAANCQACSLCRERKQVVMGDGAKTANWLFIGEGPGAEEDAAGVPFVGPAGKLLDAMLIAAKLTRVTDTYIVNAVKCRPPGSRTPTVDEVTACAPYLDRQISLLAPKIIVALGKTAITRLRLSDTDETVASLRGKRHHYREIAVVATFHPLYLYRNMQEKLKAWEDLMFAKDEYGKTVV